LIDNEDQRRHAMTGDLKMKRSISNIAVLTVLVVGNCVAQVEPSASGLQLTRSFLSDDSEVRRRAVALTLQHFKDQRAEILKALADAAGKDTNDRAYNSKLHSSIVAAQALGAVDSEDILLSVIDYELDMRSIPIGILPSETTMFPAAHALVTLRADPTRLLRRIEVASNLRQLQLLTWVLAQRVPIAEDRLYLLEKAIRGSNTDVAQKNLAEAKRLASESRVSLPPLGS
jgi:hypothetical protein